MFIEIKVRYIQYEESSRCFLKRFGPVISFSDLNFSCSEVAINNSKTNKSAYIGMTLFLDAVLLT